MALAANGAVATASSTATGSGFFTTGAINGNYRGPWGNWVEGWNDNTPNVVPDWLQVDFAGSKTIDEISVFGLHDNYTVENTPTETQTFTLYGLIAFDVQYWNGSSWTTIPGGSVTGNNKVWRKFTFSPITTSKIRVTINAVPDAWSCVVEIQAFGTSAGGEKVQWLISDHLGTPRMVLDQTGNLSSMKRHDYLPFGEEILAPTGGRSAAQGYAGDGVRQQFTLKERDVETGLDYFGARDYSSFAGRFTSADPLYYSASRPSDPQQFNLYSYVRNNPLLLVDPDGRDGYVTGETPEALEEAKKQIKRIAPGTKIDANGKIRKPGFFRRLWNRITGHGAGTTLISRIVDSKNVTLIRATEKEAGPASTPSSRMTPRFQQESGCAAVRCDYYIELNINSRDTSSDRMPDGSIQQQPFDLGVALGHELIHADIFNHFGTTFSERDDLAVHTYQVRGQVYTETQTAGEFLATGLPFVYTGARQIPKSWDITENRLRKELMKTPRLRATYK